MYRYSLWFYFEKHIHVVLPLISCHLLFSAPPPQRTTVFHNIKMGVVACPCPLTQEEVVSRFMTSSTRTIFTAPYFKTKLYREVIDFRFADASEFFFFIFIFSFYIVSLYRYEHQPALVDCASSFRFGHLALMGLPGWMTHLAFLTTSKQNNRNNKNCFKKQTVNLCCRQPFEVSVWK